VALKTESARRRGQAWRRIIDASIASARARAQARNIDPAAAPLLMLGAAEALRAIVTRIGPTDRGWALASVASDLERTALTRLAWTTPI
jgi:hypothetical protein